jgi:hypothetical protein
MLVKVTRLNYDVQYAYAPPREEALVNTDSVQSVTRTEARGEGPFCLLAFQDGTQMTVVGTPEGLLKEWYEAEHVRGLELAEVRADALGPPLLLQSEPMMYQPTSDPDKLPRRDSLQGEDRYRYFDEVGKAVAAEREACAEVAVREAGSFDRMGLGEAREAAQAIAAYIRARGKI